MTLHLSPQTCGNWEDAVSVGWAEDDVTVLDERTAPAEDEDEVGSGGDVCMVNIDVGSPLWACTTINQLRCHGRGPAPEHPTTEAMMINKGGNMALESE